MFITMTLVLRDTDKTFMAETETETLENSSETRRRLRLETVSRPRRRDRDYIPGYYTDVHGLLFTRVPRTRNQATLCSN